MLGSARRIGSIAVLLVLIVGFATREAWKPFVRAPLLRWLGAAPNSAASSAASSGLGDDHHLGGRDPTEHEHGDHDHPRRDDARSIELSKQAQANIGLVLGKIELTTFERSIAIPGIVVERPGRTISAVTAPLTGIVTEIYPIQGEAVEPGRKLFELRLTHEELVQGQGEFLRVAEELDVLEHEIERLEKIAVDGGIAGRQVLERRYEQRNKQAVIRAQHQGLLLHGLTETQIQDILRTRTLLRTLGVSVPTEAPPLDGSVAAPTTKLYEIQDLRVSRGQSVDAGETLATLADHAELYLEGNAFDKDVAAVNRALESGWSVRATFETDDANPETVNDLKILYVAGKVDPETRTFRFYLTLPNRRLRGVGDDARPRFIRWRYKPGQRVHLAVPVERWPERIVLPVDAVAQDGVEAYVFSPNGDRFERRPIRVEHRDRFSVVLANDGSVFPGDVVVTAGAQQMLLALKNQSAAAVDPHAGHTH